MDSAMDEYGETRAQADQVSALIRQLRDVEQRLQATTDGQVDAVLDPETGTPILLQHARQELRRNRARLRLILEQLPAVVWTTDADLHLTSLSGAVLSALEVDRDALVGRHISDLEALLDVTSILPAHQRALEGETATFEANLEGPVYDGWVEPTYNDGSDVVGCVGLAVDVTPRVEMEEALQASRQALERRVEERTAELSEAYEELQVTEEEIREQNEELRAARRELEAERRRYRELFAFAPDGYVVTDGNGVVEEANQAAAELLDVRADFLEGKPLSVYVAPEHQGAFYALIGRLEAAGDRRLEAELRLAPRDGEPFLASVSVARVRHEGDGTGLRWMVRDVSETERLMDENRRQRVFLERLMDVAPVGIAVVRGDDHRFEVANAYYRAIPGAQRPVVGRTFAEVFGGRSVSGVEVLDQVYRTAQAVRLRERPGMVVSGEGPTYWSVDVVPLRDGDGTVDGLLIVTRDVSREVRARKEIERLAVRIQRHADELRAVFEAMTDAVIVYDAEGVPVRANRAAIEAYGLDPVGVERDALIQKLEVRGPEGQPVAVDGLPSTRALRGERVEGARYVFCNAAGRELMIVASAAPLRSDGELSGAVVVWHDVTERERLLSEINAQRHRAEELAADLQRERDKLQTIMENTHAQLAYLDADFTFVHANTAYAEGAGYRKEELVGHNHFDLFPDEENERIFREVVETGELVSFRGKPFVYADQPERGVTYWDWSLVPVKRGDGEVEGLVFSLLNVTEREQLMRRLDAEQSRLNAIIENTPEGVVVVDERARITLTNPAADQMYARHVPYGHDYGSHGDLCICYPDGTAYRPRDLPLTRAALDGETHEDLELALIRPDGERRDLLVSTAPIQDREGATTGAVGVFRDITERKLIEEAVRQYAERLRALHELDQAILLTHSAEEIAETTLDRLRQLVRCRRASVELFDFEAEETILLAVDTEGETRLRKRRRMPLSWNRSLDDLREGQPHVVEDLSLAPLSPLIEALRQEGVRSFVSLPLRVRDELMGALSIGMATSGAPGPEQMAAAREMAQELAIGIHHAWLHRELEAYADELEQRVAARTAQLRASEARFRAIFEQSALGIALLDRQGRVIASNAALEEILGRSSDELLGRTFTDFAHPDEEVAGDVAIYRELRDGHRDHHRVETRYARPDGETRWANMVLSLVRDIEGEPQFIIAIVGDITERKRAHQALIQSEKLATTGRLAASLAHEINNPLQTVIGCLGLAEETMEAGEDDVETYVSMAHDELQRAARIVSRLRDLSRPSERERGEPTDVNRLVDGVLEVSRKDLKDHRIRIVRHLEDDLPRPMVMPDRMKQVLLNLLLNARDAMPRGGELHVGTGYHEEKDEVVITVTDQGAGIPQELMDRLFDPFFSTKEEGTGLGLFVSQNIMQEHGGRIEVESKVGDGATFKVVLPVSRSR
jgi:PAS domain S-box-containing protein